jgi:hypothetical protein
MTLFSNTPSFLKLIYGNKLLCLFVVAASISSFFVGAGLYRAQDWPFGQDYYAKVRQVVGLSPPSAARKAEEARKAAAEASKKAKILSVLGEVGLSVYDLPFEDGNPSGPIEALAADSIMFIGRCGNIYNTILKKDTIKIVTQFDLNTIYEKVGLEKVYCDGKNSGGRNGSAC